jgi:hypothetical protein
MFYNLIMHRESTVFPNVEKHCRYLLMLIKFESYDMGVFFIVFLRFFLNIEKGIGYKKYAASAPVDLWGRIE